MDMLSKILLAVALGCGMIAIASIFVLFVLIMIDVLR